jgi:hypothetical protein
VWRINLRRIGTGPLHQRRPYRYCVNAYRDEAMNAVLYACDEKLRNGHRARVVLFARA